MLLCRHTMISYTYSFLYFAPLIVAGFSDARSNFSSTATIFLVILSCINLTLEGLQVFNRKLKYFTEWQNYVEISLSTLTISFVLSVRFNDCFCPNASQWQLGSVVIFLAWANLILLMKSIPFVAISINMLISIMNSFVKLVFLSVLLIVAFGIPLFLLFHQPVSYLLHTYVCLKIFYVTILGI